MSENITHDLSGGDGRSFEERVFARFDARFGAMEEHLTALEEKVDSRLRETRPIREAVQATLKEIHF